jgi:hypothetical protein
MEDLKAFYTGVIRSVLEYGAQIWNGSITGEQSNDIERLQKRALRIILPAWYELRSCTTSVQFENPKGT